VTFNKFIGTSYARPALLLIKMCVSTMANDGGLQQVFHSADLVYKQLLVLNKQLYDCNTATAAAAAACGGGNSAGVKRKPSRSLSEVSSSSLVKASKINLSHHSTAALRRAVAPLIHSMEQLDAAALLSLNPNRDGNGAVLDLEKDLSVPPIHDRIVPYHMNHHDNTVRYLHCREIADRYSVGIFIFPPGASIPLHDHPSMVVISRVLYGQLKVKSYSVVSPVHDAQTMDSDEIDDDRNWRNNVNSDSPSRFRSSFNMIKDFVSRAVSSRHDYHAATRHKLQVQENESPLGVQFSSDRDGKRTAIISAPNVTALYPDEGNCHSFEAGPNGAAVLDVLLPPYAEDEHRDCTFYEATENEHGYCLVPIDQPSDFNCLSGEYGRFISCEQY
jgi:predicted metal-dependent enzyme (double-stranded beta helix superfamily)